MIRPLLGDKPMTPAERQRRRRERLRKDAPLSTAQQLRQARAEIGWLRQKLAAALKK